MCTLILAWRVLDDAPIAVAANRDERLGRPSTGPAVRDGPPRYLAPRDEEADGTWIGVNERGLFVGITNRRTDLVGERSRGQLVLDALSQPGTGAALSVVERELAEREYAGFNLVLADAERAVLLAWDGVLRQTEFVPGVHVVVNEGHDESAAKSRRIRTALVDQPDEPEGGTSTQTVADWWTRAKRVLRDHHVGACIHADGYGTRSSSLVSVGADGAVHYEFADGPPCETDYRRVDGQL